MDSHAAQAAAPAAREHFYVIHEGPGVVKRPFDVFDFRSGRLVAVRHGSPWLIRVLGLAPGLVAWLPGELGGVKRRVVRAWVIGAGQALDAGELVWQGGVVVMVMVLWGLGAASLSAVRLGRRLQSSIRSRGADQGVVRCSGAQSSWRPSLSSWARRPDIGASSPEHAPRALVVSASLV